MIKKNIVYIYMMLYFVLCLYIIIGCKASTDKKETENLSSPDTSYQTHEEVKNVLTEEEINKQKFNTENEAWVNEHVNKDFLLGKVKRQGNPLFVLVDKEHTERNIYLIFPVYEAYKKMYDAALADSIKLIITSGHRTFVEQFCEWQLRWDNPRTNIQFPNDIEKAKYVLQYRSMPGTSRHHWGTDIDLNNYEFAYYQTKEGQKIYKWLNENAATYGFFQPYTPIDEQRAFGYQEEKWHWSYKPLARLMLIKYLDLVSIHDISGFKGDKAAKVLPIITEWVCGINPEINEPD
jgi:LAS superfamily LD-carboxypeptidase LdcB